MNTHLTGLVAYDPSEIKFSLIFESKGVTVTPYGFVSDRKIYYKDGGIFFELQATSESVPLLLTLVSRPVKVNLNTRGPLKDLLEHFDLLEGYLFLVQADICTAEVGKVVFRIAQA